MSVHGMLQAIAAALWTAYGFVSGFGQAVIWAVLVVFFAAAVLLSLGAARRPPGRRETRVPRELTRSREAQWRSLLSPLDPGRGQPYMLIHELRRLALAVLAHTEGGQAADLGERIGSGRLDAGEDIRWLFEQRDMHWQEPRVGLFRRGKPVPGARLDRQRVARILDALERRLGPGEGPERKTGGHED